MPMWNSILAFLNEQSMVTLFAIIALGSILGSLKVRGVSLGASGVLFAGLFFGHFGVSVPEVIVTLGVVLFVYAVGLQAGPRFVRSFIQHGVQFLLLVLVTLSAGVVACLALACWLELSPNLCAGIFAGALTSTPGLAASVEILADPTVSVGFGAAYPFGVLGVILFVQLVPRLLRIDLTAEEQMARTAADVQPVINGWFRIENPLIAGRTVEEVSAAHLTDTQLSRVAKGEQTEAARAELVLELGDHVRAVGTPSELHRLEMILGPKVPDLPETKSNVTTMTLHVTEHAVVGKSLAELKWRERYGINVTRIFRDEFEFVPHGVSRLEFGDTIRVAGATEDCQRLVSVVGHQEEKLRETQFLPLALGLVAGVLFGLLPLPIPGGLEMRLGLAGGPLLAGLIAGHFGRLGRLSFRIPVAALYFIREIGLLFFLAGAGVGAGAQFWQVMQAQGMPVVVIAVATAIVPMVAAFAFARMVLKWDALTAFGAICGAMTSTPGLGLVSKMSRTPAASLAYVAVYPAALIGTTILAPGVGILLSAWFGN